VANSPLNFMVLGLILEELEEKPFSELGAAEILAGFGRGRATLTPNPDERHGVAPGAYSKWLGRMAWTEPAEPFGLALVPNAGHTGLVTAADDVMARATTLLPIGAVMVNWKDTRAGQVYARALAPDPSIPGGESMGLGFQLGRYGPKSYGWDSPHGSSVWMLPDQLGYVIYLSNEDHPKDDPDRTDSPREKALTLLGKALGWPRPLVDTAGENQDASSLLEQASPTVPDNADD
jgi:CubicO group peptidase (beta-lactamase class C family)